MDGRNHEVEAVADEAGDVSILAHPDGRAQLTVSTLSGSPTHRFQSSPILMDGRNPPNQ